MKRIRAAFIGIIVFSVVLFSAMAIYNKNQTSPEVIQPEIETVVEEPVQVSDYIVVSFSSDNTYLVEGSIDGERIVATYDYEEASVGDALYQDGVISDPSFFDTVLGKQLVWEETQMYWCFYNNNEMSMVGVQETPIDTTAQYKIEATK